MLPKHLLPKALGGDVGDDDLDLDDGNGLTANKKNMLSTMKKIKNKDQQIKENKKQAEDAKFLDGLFNDNLSEDTDRQELVREEQYDNIRDQLNQNDAAADNFLLHLDLP